MNNIPESDSKSITDNIRAYITQWNKRIGRVVKYVIGAFFLAFVSAITNYYFSNSTGQAEDPYQVRVLDTLTNIAGHLATKEKMSNRDITPEQIGSNKFDARILAQLVEMNTYFQNIPPNGMDTTNQNFSITDSLVENEQKDDIGRISKNPLKDLIPESTDPSNEIGEGSKNPKSNFVIEDEISNTKNKEVHGSIQNNEEAPISQKMAIKYDKHISFANESERIYRGFWPVSKTVLRWTIYLESKPVILSNISHVIYELHDTFDPNRVVIDYIGPDTQRAFAITRQGWGIFTIKIKIVFKDGSVLPTSHKLKFDQ